MRTLVPHRDRTERSRRIIGPEAGRHIGLRHSTEGQGSRQAGKGRKGWEFHIVGLLWR